MYLNYGHMSPTQFIQIFSSASSVQQHIIPKRLNQIYSVVRHWTEEISNSVSFKQICHLYQILRVELQVEPKRVEQKSALNTDYLSPISIDRSTLRYIKSVDVVKHHHGKGLMTKCSCICGCVLYTVAHDTT